MEDPRCCAWLEKPALELIPDRILRGESAESFGTVHCQRSNATISDDDRESTSCTARNGGFNILRSIKRPLSYSKNGLRHDINMKLPEERYKLPTDRTRVHMWNC